MTMGESFDFPRADVFWPGADGPPGQRVFFLAGGDEGGLVYLRCEKQQVAALGEYLLALLDDLSPGVEPADALGAVTPLPYAWDVGSIGVKYDEPKLRTVIWDFASESVPDDLLIGAARVADEGGPDVLARLLDPAERAALVHRAHALVDRGTFPIDLDGRCYPWPLV